jgi:hypothetical protein
MFILSPVRPAIGCASPRTLDPQEICCEHSYHPRRLGDRQLWSPNLCGRPEGRRPEHAGWPVDVDCSSCRMGPGHLGRSTVVFLMNSTVLMDVLINATVALFAAAFAVWLAFRRFQSEKWFERRIEAYMRVFDALHDIKWVTQVQQRALSQGRELSSEREEEVFGTYRRALSQIHRSADVGSLLFHPGAVAALDGLLEALADSSEQQPWINGYGDELLTIDGCLANLRTIAKKDLSARRWV